MKQEATVEHDLTDYSPLKSRWQENHGNLLMAFVGFIFLVGSGVLMYRQTRFVPPRFPDSDSITLPEEEFAASGQASQIGRDDVVLIRVTGAANDFGNIKIAVYESESSFNNPDLAMATNTLELQDGEAVWAVPVSRMPARVAIAAYHDENEDDQLTLNRFGIPSERYGFSNNARGLTGPPNFQQSVIELPPGGETLNIYIR